MFAVITKKEKNRIMILGAITAVLGAAAASIGIYLRRELTKSESWSNEEKIAEFTNGYFGVMSGFAVSSLSFAQPSNNENRRISRRNVYFDWSS